MNIEHNPHSRNLAAWAADKPEVVVLSGDLTGSTEISDFKLAYPNRFFSLGMAEQNMLSWAGGMAREGFTPFIHTFAVFLYRRPYDQLAMSIAYPNLKVRLFGFLPGITTPGGVTHQAIEDIAVLRGLPNMTIIEVGDATEIETMLDEVQSVNGPVYVRMLRGAVPRLFPKDEPFTLNRARVLRTGDDITLITSGICTEEALKAAGMLVEKGLSIEHLHVSTLKPFTDPQIAEAVKKSKYGVITMENHTSIGGLGSAVAEVMAEQGTGVKLYRIGLQDTFSHGGSKIFLQKEYGLDAVSLVRRVEQITGRSFDINEEDLLSARLDTFSSARQLEAL
jgi:transketolase